MNDRPMFLEPLEVQALLEAPNTRSATGLRNRCIMGLMYEGGLRVSEVLALKPRDVNIRERRVEVLRGKGAKSRTAYFRSVTLSELLERWKETRPESEYLFCNVRSAVRGGQVAPRNIQRAVAGYAQAAGIPGKVTPHSLRHTCATEMMRRGVNLRVIQEALGHSWISTTQAYTHVVNEDVRQAMGGTA
jgi:integrase/recombinase XerD